MELIDQFSRKINYLRVSVTDRCDLRCVYCMKEKMNFLPKPNLQTYKKLIATYNLDVKKAILFDDIPQNLIPAADLGLKTVQVYNKKLLKELNGTSKKIDYMTNNLKEWLQKWMLDN